MARLKPAATGVDTFPVVVPALRSSDPPPVAPIRPANWPGIGLAVVCALAAFAVAGFLLIRDQPPPDRSEAVEVVDSLLDDMAGGDWEAAHQRFDASCTAFSVGAYRRAFEPVLEGYRGHEVLPVTGERAPDEPILLVRGFVELAPGGPHPVRAELVFTGTPESPAWRLCGFRIDTP